MSRTNLLRERVSSFQYQKFSKTQFSMTEKFLLLWQPIYCRFLEGVSKAETNLVNIQIVGKLNFPSNLGKTTSLSDVD